MLTKTVHVDSPHHRLQAQYSPNRSEILVGPGRQINKHLFEQLRLSGSQANVTFARIRDLYPRFEYSDVAQHPAIVLIPYQVCAWSYWHWAAQVALASVCGFAKALGQ